MEKNKQKKIKRSSLLKDSIILKVVIGLVISIILIIIIVIFLVLNKFVAKKVYEKKRNETKKEMKQYDDWFREIVDEYKTKIGDITTNNNDNIPQTCARKVPQNNISLPPVINSVPDNKHVPFQKIENIKKVVENKPKPIVKKIELPKKKEINEKKPPQSKLFKKMKEKKDTILNITIEDKERVDDIIKDMELEQWLDKNEIDDLKKSGISGEGLKTLIKTIKKVKQNSNKTEETKEEREKTFSKAFEEKVQNDPRFIDYLINNGLAKINIEKDEIDLKDSPSELMSALLTFNSIQQQPIPIPQIFQPQSLPMPQIFHQQQQPLFFMFPENFQQPNFSIQSEEEPSRIQPLDEEINQTKIEEIIEEKTNNNSTISLDDTSKPSSEVLQKIIHNALETIPLD
jgi:Na+-transporting methylmalonyl-CoA/oxaloacetate decarboxylase gamma subunit